MLSLSDRAVLASPLPLIVASEARLLGIRVTGARWMRLRRGIHVERAGYLALPPWRRYAVRVHAFVQRHPDAILCLESAAVLHGLPLFGEPRDIHVHDPERATSRRFGDVCVHTSVDARTVVRVGHTLLSSALDTVTDLARLLPPAHALALVDSAISPVQGGTLSMERLWDHSLARVDDRGRRRLRWALGESDKRSESPAESISRAVISWSGFERPELQSEFRYDGALDRVDFLFPTRRAIGEADGWQKYGLTDPDAAARALRDEKRREDRLRRHGHPFARWELRDAWQVEPLCRALRAAGVPLVRPAQSQMLASLRHNPREKPRTP
ncbi:MAG: hypothetical protein P0Y60_15485 [Candidatus Microbacterium colombiense]|nr:MAG: hypothetical protein P0Y60_15485 [Microbacterium sp.]